MAVGRLLRLCAVLVTAACAAAACTTGHAIRPEPTAGPGIQFAPWSSAPTPYRLHPGDQIEIRFPYVPELNVETIIPPDGRLSLPLVPAVNALDATLDQLARTLDAAYAPIVQRPEAVVLLKASPSWRVYVGGAVERQGAVPLTGRLGPLEAIIQAGGFRSEARLDQVVLIRRGPDRRPMVRLVDVKAVIERGDASADLPLQAGDILFVPRSAIGEFDLWIDQFITRALPFNRDFSYTLNKNL